MSIPLRNVNNILLVIVIVVNLYVLAVPFLPQLLFQIQKSQGKQQELQAVIEPPAKTPGSSTPAAATKPATTGVKGNQVIIPVMTLDQPIVEGNNVYRALDQGVWRWPGGSTPDKGGNTVLVGHRFTYTKPKGVFYFMDKVHTGDNVGIIWGSKTYTYTVTSTEVVSPSKTSILSQTADPTLTMYTCTPLWNPKQRLVVHASLTSVQ